LKGGAFVHIYGESNKRWSVHQILSLGRNEAVRNEILPVAKAVHKSFANQAKKRFLHYFRLQVKI